MILKKPTLIMIVLSLVAILILAVPQSALAVPGVCPASYTYITKYDWEGGTWVVDSGSPNVITFLPGSNAYTGTWTSSVDISAFVMTDGKYDHDPVWGAYYYPEGTRGPNSYDSGDMLPPRDPHKAISNVVFCGSPYPVTLVSFTTQANRGTVTIDWNTSTEINTAGFLLYRSTTLFSPQVQVNANLIAAKGDGVTGAGYRITDSPGYGTFYYWLMDVDYSGQTILHGPVMVRVLPAVRQPVSLPNLPGQ